MDYLPNARVLKNIRLKKRAFSDNVLQELTRQQLDTSAISKVLEDGDVLFSQSDTERDDCNLYVIRGEVSEKWLKITVENCENLAKVEDITITKTKN
ncbi:MAG: hypothetical protein Aureis2KO_09410 [Aureisphaera sp.]